MAQDKAYLEAGEVWDSMPVIARVALCSAADLPGKTGSKRWGMVDDQSAAVLIPLLVDNPVAVPLSPGLVQAAQSAKAPAPADTDSTDRSEHAGWIGGKPVYRASMAGNCMKELFLWRIGTGQYLPHRDESYDTEDAGMLGAREGQLHEAWIIQSLQEEGYETAWTGDEQMELERKYKRYVVRSHPDGMIRGKELGDEWHVLECKALNQERFLLWQSTGWDAFTGYAHQVSLEMDLSGKKAYFVVKNRNTGRMVRQVVETPPVNPKSIYRKYSRIEDIIEAAGEGLEPALPECGPNAEWYFCPFFNLGKCDILQGRDAEEIDEIDDEEFISILDRFKAAKNLIKVGETEVEALRVAITDRMVKPRLKVGPYFTSFSERIRKGFNIPLAKQTLEKHGEDTTKFDKESKYMELRVTGGPKDEEE